MSDLDDFRTQMLVRQAEAEQAFVNGDPDPRMELWSRRDPVTLFGAGSGECKTGWDQVTRIFRWIASTFDSAIFDQRPPAEGA
jgi:hypothetical protein